MVEAIAHVECGRDVDHGAHGVDRFAQIVLDEVRALRLHVDTHVHVVFLSVQSQLDVSVVAVLRAL